MNRHGAQAQGPVRNPHCRKTHEGVWSIAFSSLDAQREGCAAYIDSQRHEGWLALDDHYDDGGYSGGTLVWRPRNNVILDRKPTLDIFGIHLFIE